MYLQNDVSLLQVPVSGSQSCAGHLFDENLAAQPKTILCWKRLKIQLLAVWLILTPTTMTSTTIV